MVQPLAVKRFAATLVLALGLAPAVPASEEAKAPPADSERSREEPADEVVAQQGEVRILLTGSCGEEGRRAVLQNRHPAAAVKAKVETSEWDEGSLRTSSVRLHTLAPLTEKELGCTEISRWLERRFALVEVSNAAMAPGPRPIVRRNDQGRPVLDLRLAREFITFALAGTCGREGEGQRVRVLNEHPERSFRVRIEHVVKVGGTLRSRDTKSYTLDPGDSRALGCGRDGNMTQTYQLLSAE